MNKPWKDNNMLNEFYSSSYDRDKANKELGYSYSTGKFRDISSSEKDIDDITSGADLRNARRSHPKGKSHFIGTLLDDIGGGWNRFTRKSPTEYLYNFKKGVKLVDNGDTFDLYYKAKSWEGGEPHFVDKKLTFNANSENNFFYSGEKGLDSTEDLGDHLVVDSKGKLLNVNLSKGIVSPYIG